MVSRMDSICERYAAGCTKTEPKILQVKRGQKQRNAPGKARKRRNWVRFGCWRGWERLWAGANGWESLAIGQKDLSRLPARASSRHAVLEWMWKNASERAGGGGVARFLLQDENVRCWFGAASSFWRRIVYRLPLLPSKEKHLRQEDGQADQDHGRVGPGGI